MTENKDKNKKKKTQQKETEIVTSLPSKYEHAGASSDSLLGGIIKSFRTSVFDMSLDGGGTGMVTIGSYIPNKNGFNIRNALTWAQKHVGASSQGKCAYYVRMMLVAGGINTAGNPVAAKDYAKFLPSKGFKHIATLTGVNNQTSWTQTSAQAGDIAVMAHGTYGHICMYTGVQWVSDFVQRKMWPYSGDGTCYIFRFG